MAVITISRELGSEGDLIAQKVSEELGVPLVGRQLIEEAARRAGLPQEILDAKEREAAMDRSFSSSDMVGLLRRSQAGRRQQLEDALYTKYMTEAVIAAAASACVIVGRGSQFILRDRRDALHVHLHAPEEVRIARVMRAEGLSRAEAEKRVRASDLERSNYIKRYFNNASWRNPDYYDLMIDTSKISPEVAAAMIVLAARSLG
jgi:cytidylate kinase